MKKVFKLMSAALIALASFVPAQAETMTVYDGTVQNEIVPLYGFYYDAENYTVQTIYQEADVAALQGAFINSMKFYLAAANTLTGGTLSVSIGSTTQSQFPYNYGSAIEGLTHVADITMTTGETEIMVNFDEPWAYTGGNIVIETVVKERGNYSHVNFLGQESEVYNAIYIGAAGAYGAAFCPKTTFDYDVLDDKAAVTPQALAFGQLFIDETATKSITIKNLGKNAFTPVLSALNAPFSLEAAATEVAAGTSIEIPVKFAPDAAGEFNQTLTIDCGAAGQFEVTLTAAAIERPTEVVVADGTVNNDKVPMYGYSYDKVGGGNFSQMIYTADMLTDLAGKKINYLKFYPTAGMKMNGGNMQLSFKVVDQDAFAATTAIAEMTVVANAVPVKDASELVFTLAEPFEYNGGNLAIEVLATQEGTFGMDKFYGIAKAGASYAHYEDFGANDDIVDFLPKATFGYVKEEAEPITVYTVVGPDAIFGSNWDTTDTINDMVEADGIYTWTKEGVALYGNFDFKVVGNHSYEAYEWPMGPNNWTANVPEEGIYTIMISFDPNAADDARIICNLTKTGDITPVEHTYTIAGTENLFGSNWNTNDEANNMVKGEDGIYTWSKSGVEFAADEVVEFKVVQDHAWTYAWPSQNRKYTCEEAGKYDVAITFNAETKEITFDATPVVEPSFEIGDVNHDNNVSIADVTALIDILLSNDAEAPAEADVNGDTNVTIADVTALIDKLLGGN